MIELQNVSKVFRAPSAGEPVRALDDVSVAVRRGELVAVVGPSGSGKSTLLHTIGALSKPSEGEVRLGDVRPYDLGVEARAALRLREIGYVFQTFNLVPYLSCLDNVALPRVLIGARRREARNEALALLARLGLAPRRGHLPAQLSVGERQRVAIARALVNGPKVLLADEPTGNLDERAADAVMELLLEVHAGGQTIVLVTHDARISRRAPRVLTLASGRVVEPLACELAS